MARVDDLVARLRAERDAALARIAGAAKLHRREVRGSGWEVCTHCEVGMLQDPVDWPCPTAVSLGLNEGGNENE